MSAEKRVGGEATYRHGAQVKDVPVMLWVDSSLWGYQEGRVWKEVVANGQPGVIVPFKGFDGS